MRKFLIMRGLPGSGKTHEAMEVAKRHLNNRGRTVKICSTDHFHMKDGIYKFDPEKIAEYHAANQDEARDAAIRGVNIVIIDNTNINASQFLPYVQIAQKARYEVDFVEPTSRWWLKNRGRIGRGKEMSSFEVAEIARVFWSMTDHNVPMNVIEDMIDAWQNIDPDDWKQG